MTSFKVRLYGGISVDLFLKNCVCVFNRCMCACGGSVSKMLSVSIYGTLKLSAVLLVDFFFCFQLLGNPVLAFGSFTDYIKASINV